MEKCESVSIKVFLFPKEFFMVPRIWGRNGCLHLLSSCREVRNLLRKCSTHCSTLIKQPHPHNHHLQLTDFTGLWKKLAAHPPPGSILVCRERIGINKETHHTCLVNTACKQILNAGVCIYMGVFLWKTEMWRLKLVLNASKAWAEVP